MCCNAADLDDHWPRELIPLIHTSRRVYSHEYMLWTFAGICLNKNSAEVNIAPAFGEITTACNVGQAKKGHGACLKILQNFDKVSGG